MEAVCWAEELVSAVIFFLLQSTGFKLMWVNIFERVGISF
ncbi:putative membrane protein [Piscirickettsia salmonis LF-89 = ATCC VR-1361]|nr:putative membrane protein [Piscirickettsia salmonis LF-89 = ATCC VR-1361]